MRSTTLKNIRLPRPKFGQLLATFTTPLDPREEPTCFAFEAARAGLSLEQTLAKADSFAGLQAADREEVIDSYKYATN